LTHTTEAAARHLDDLRTAIDQLREEREQATRELLQLTRLDPARLTVDQMVAPPRAVEPAVVEPDAVAGGVPTLGDLNIDAAFAAAMSDEAPGATTSASRDAAVERPATAASVRPASPAAGRADHIQDDVLTPRVVAPSAEEQVESAAFVDFRSEKPEQVPSPAGDAAAHVTLPVFSTMSAPPPRRRWPLALATVLIVAAIGVAWFAYSSRQRAGGKVEGLPPDTPQPGSAAPLERAAAPTAPPASFPADDPGATPPGETPDAPRAASPAPATGESRLELVPTRDVWVRVIVDGAQRVSGLVPADRPLAFDFTTSVSVRAGDAGALRVIHNGEPRGPFGADGAVLTRVFDAAREAPR
jgi:hypothetical protein